MNEALQSYTPTERPLEYDSLEGREGCEVISGTDFLGWRAYEQICVFAHNPANKEFAQPDKVSYSIGPVTPGTPDFPFNTYWSAWVGSTGVRIRAIGFVSPPAQSLGVQSGLYPNTLPAKVAHAFNNAALLAIAIQKNATQIEIKRYTSTNPDTDGDIATVLFTGASPVMFNSSILDSSIESKSGLVCLYLRPELPAVLFGRFERDTTPFGVERVLMPDLRVHPARLIGTRREGRRQVLRYIDVEGRDVYLTSPVYVVEASGNAKLGVQSMIAGGRAFSTAIPADTGFDKAPKITMALAGGVVYAATQLPSAPNNPLPADAVTFAASMEGGEVSRP